MPELRCLPEADYVTEFSATVNRSGRGVPGPRRHLLLPGGWRPADFDDGKLARIERLENEAIARDAPVVNEGRPRAQVEATVDGGWALIDQIPKHADSLQVFEIPGFDCCPCGGSHVDRLAEDGRVVVTGRESKSAYTGRLTFTPSDR